MGLFISQPSHGAPISVSRVSSSSILQYEYMYQARRVVPYVSMLAWRLELGKVKAASTKQVYADAETRIKAGSSGNRGIAFWGDGEVCCLRILFLFFFSYLLLGEKMWTIYLCPMGISFWLGARGLGGCGG